MAVPAEQPPTIGRDRRPVLVFGAVATALAAVLLYLGRGRTFYFDEWDWVQGRSFGGLDSLLQPHNEHVSIVPAAVYRVLFETAGFGSTLPMRALVIVLHLACAAVVFDLASRRVGRAGAAVAGILMLCVGAAFEDLLWGFQIGFVGSALGGLIAFAALDRGGRVASGVACVALLLGGLSSSLGIPMAIGIGVEMLSRREWRRLWIPAVPVAAYAAWYLGYGRSSITEDGVFGATTWAVDAAAASTAAALGQGIAWGRPLLLAALALAAWALWTGRARPSPRLWGLLGAASSFWLLTGAARSAGSTPQPPETSRYLYLGAAMVVLLAVELLRGRQVSPRILPAAAAALAVVALSGLGLLRTGGEFLRGNSDRVSGQIAAVELAAEQVPEDLRFSVEAPQLVAGTYLDAVRFQQSSPAPDLDELLEAPEATRQAADELLLTVLRAPAAQAPSRCEQLAATGTELVLPDGGIAVRATGGGIVDIRVKRFAAGYGAPTVTTPAGETSVLRLAADEVDGRPWSVQVQSTSTFEVCR